MLSILLNAANFVVSKETRESVESVLDLLNQQPEWQKDVCTIEAAVPKSSSEQLLILQGLLLEKLKSLSYPEALISDAKLVFTELTRNAIDHGSTSPSDKVAVTLEITREYVSISVTNHRVKFRLSKALKEAADRRDNDPLSPRGRGLLMAANCSKSLDSIGRGRGVKSVLINKNHVSPGSGDGYRWGTIAGTAAFWIGCEVDLHNSPDIRTAMLKLLQTETHNEFWFLIDSPYLDSSGIAILVEAVQFSRKNAKSIRWIFTQRRVQGLIDIGRLATVFDQNSAYEASLEAMVQRIGLLYMSDFRQKLNLPSGPQ